MQEHQHHIEVLFPTPEDSGLLLQAVALIQTYAEIGLMVAISEERLTQMAAQGMLALAVNESQEVVGTAAVTFVWPDGSHEFGGWAVKDEYKKHGVGHQLFFDLFNHVGTPDKVIAFGNHNSAPIFKKMGAVLLGHDEMHPDAFEPCKTCKCHGKEDLPMGQKCVDSIFNLKPVLLGAK